MLPQQPLPVHPSQEPVHLGFVPPFGFTVSTGANRYGFIYLEFKPVGWAAALDDWASTLSEPRFGGDSSAAIYPNSMPFCLPSMQYLPMAPEQDTDFEPVLHAPAPGKVVYTLTIHLL